MSEVISIKDVERYCGILHKNNTIKWICRFYFSGNKKSIIISDENESRVRHYIDCITDIYSYKAELIALAQKYIEHPVLV